MVFTFSANSSGIEMSKCSSSSIMISTTSRLSQPRSSSNASVSLIVATARHEQRAVGNKPAIAEAPGQAYSAARSRLNRSVIEIRLERQRRPCSGKIPELHAAWDSTARHEQRTVGKKPAIAEAPGQAYSAARSRLNRSAIEIRLERQRRPCSGKIPELRAATASSYLCDISQLNPPAAGT